jgi:hypothetical protein
VRKVSVTKKILYLKEKERELGIKKEVIGQLKSRRNRKAMQRGVGNGPRLHPDSLQGREKSKFKATARG